MLHYHIVRMELEMQRAEAERRRRNARFFDDAQIKPVVRPRFRIFSFKRHTPEHAPHLHGSRPRFAFSSIVVSFRARRV
ncbi:MAG: hypothetical protein DIU68_016525 [Chloroflexota bacterium]|nr:MAG: hypothetical protein DIU68_09385 [Chloroflexota bacterium]